MAFIWPTNMAARVGEQQLAPLGRCGAVQFSFSGAFTDRSALTSGLRIGRDRVAV